MAVRRPRRPAPRRKASTRTAKPARARTSGKKTAASRPRSAARAVVALRRRTEPETLRLRAIDPSLTVDDLDRSIRFYTDVLGFIVGARWTDGDVLRGVMLKAGACQLGLTQDDWAKGRDRQKGQGIRLWCKTAQDIDALAGRITAAGGALTEGPMDQAWGARTLAVQDPDGFAITLYREP